MNSQFGGVDNGSLKDISSENEKLRQMLDQVLNILRLDVFVNDYLPEKVELSEVVTHAIK